jgi:CelD/BcsL family acetyltransferase involved in cellulose biosynthesis
MGLDEKLFYFNLALPRWSPSQWFSRSQAASGNAVDGLAAQWHDRWPEDAGFAAEFDVLLRSRPFASAFHTPDWQGAVARPFIRVGRYRLLSIRDEKGLAGVLPLWIRSDDVLESAGALISDYLEPLLREGDETAVWTACLRAMGGTPGVQPKGLVLHNVRTEFIAPDALQAAAAQEGFSLQIESVTKAQRVPLQDSWDAFLAGLGAHDRKEIRRKLRNAESKAGARLLVADKEDEVLPALETTLSFMRRVSGRKGLKAQWSYRPIFSRAGPGLARGGWLRVYLLELQGRVSAGTICFPSAHGPLLWGTGFDEAMRAWSPGIVLFSMAMRHAIGEGARNFDFLRGEARYKAELGAVESPISRITLTRNAG